MGLVWSQPSHAIVNKWLLLSDAENAAAGGKGYLKVCVCVLGPGDEAPSFKHGLAEAEDIEANLIKSPGVRLVWKLELFACLSASWVPEMRRPLSNMDWLKRRISKPISSHRESGPY